MAIPHARANQVVNLRPGGEDLAAAVSAAIVKHDNFEVIRLVIPKGHKIPPHQVAGPITVQCLIGSVNFTSAGQTQEIETGQWLFLPGNEPHSLVGLEDSVVLVTIIFAN